MPTRMGRTARAIPVLLSALCSVSACSISLQGTASDESLDSGSKPPSYDSAASDEGFSGIDATSSDSTASSDGPPILDGTTDALFETAPTDSGALVDSVVIDGGVDTTPADTAPEAPLDTGPVCTEPGAIRYGGHCYFRVGAPLSNDGGKFACAAGGAHLVTITSTGEAAALAPFALSDAWIGLRRADTAPPTKKDSFKWVTGETSSFDHWVNETGWIEPNGSGACGRMVPAPQGFWADDDCANVYPYVCERE